MSAYVDGNGVKVCPGDPVRKVGGDYRFDGWIITIFTKREGALRIVVEDDRGVLFIARPEQYVRRQ